jgi:hypothetical protein
MGTDSVLSVLSVLSVVQIACGAAKPKSNYIAILIFIVAKIAIIAYDGSGKETR